MISIRKFGFSNDVIYIIYIRILFITPYINFDVLTILKLYTKALYINCRLYFRLKLILLQYIPGGIKINVYSLILLRKLFLKIKKVLLGI